jgi:MtN3 and saliva related transmembrane protein
MSDNDITNKFDVTNFVFVNYVGLLATLFLIFIPLPQLWKTIKTKSTRDLSIWYIIIQLLANSSYALYGILMNDPFVYVSNIIVVICNIVMIMLKCVYDNRTDNIDSVV